MINDDPSIVQPVFETVKQAFNSGKTRDLNFRRQQLKNLIRGINELDKQFHDALKNDLGASQFTSYLTSTSISLLDIEHTLSNFKKWAQKKSVDTSVLLGPAKSYIVPEPYGVVLIIGAWNYPLFTTLPYVATCIASGNSIILKPSEMASHSSKIIAELFEKYLDNECYKVVEGATEVAKKLTALPLDMIIFTGSTDKGKLVAKAAAENLTPCILELGGKSPTIVDRDADIENAALRIASGRWTNCGQTCVATDYLLVHKDIKIAFVKALKQKLIEFFGANPKNSSDYVRIINEFHSKRLQGYLTEDHGGKILYGNLNDIDIKEKYVPPFIVENPKLNSQMMQDEIFGPILPIIDINNIDEAIKYINSRPKPLALYYYGSIFSAAKDRLINETSSGSIVFNDSIFQVLHENLPFGGVGFSGMGAVHGEIGFKSTSHFKPIMDKAPINLFPLSCRFPPYTTSRQMIMKTLLKSTNFPQKKAVYGILFIGLVIGAVSYKKGYFNPLVEKVKGLVSSFLKMKK